ncbi:hypothetical protein [Xanthomonas arboricola]|uniref:hypothetical protein n=1 Tax=Xanthomonas arboricola TaxID=56448 RepID=UPI00201950AA|nr:hypothetical protein [Xanthomonas arboricola]UQQ13292.1 hypothetical protein KPG65_11880 [Xanthomonas arboricola pv. corylina]
MAKPYGKESIRIHVVSVSCWLTPLLVNAQIINQQLNQQLKPCGTRFSSFCWFAGLFFQISSSDEKSEVVRKVSNSRETQCVRKSYFLTSKPAVGLFFEQK